MTNNEAQSFRRTITVYRLEVRRPDGKVKYSHGTHTECVKGQEMAGMLGMRSAIAHCGTFYVDAVPERFTGSYYPTRDAD